MTFDRDLIELAARAIGRTVEGWEDDHKAGTYAAILDDGSWFQPLHQNHRTDCMGDALRLAVRLKMDLMHNEPLDSGWVMAANLHHVEDVPDESMRDAATRRAITSAAAEIARRSMRPGEGKDCPTWSAR